MWKFSHHALKRIKERVFSQDALLRILKEEAPSIILPSPREDSVDLYFGKIDLRYVLIVVDKYTHTVITVRPLRKMEKLVFIKETENE